MSSTVQVNQEYRTKVMSYVKEKYSLTNLLIDLKVWNGYSSPIKCPFHSDSRPSFYIVREDNYWHCFSCGASGGYLSFYHKYYNEIENDGKSFNKHLDTILSQDAEMIKELGFNSIFTKTQVVFTKQSLEEFTKPKTVLLKTDVRSLETIRRKLSDEPVDVLLDFYADIERGLSVQELWSIYVDKIDYVSSLSRADNTVEDELEKFFTNVFDLSDDDDNDSDSGG